MLNICRVVNNLKARKWLATNTLVTGNLAALVEIMIKPMAMPNNPDDWSI